MDPERRKNPYCTVWRKLKFKAYSSPEWNKVAKQLRHRCAKQDVPCEKTPKQCKDNSILYSDLCLLLLLLFFVFFLLHCELLYAYEKKVHSIHLKKKLEQYIVSVYDNVERSFFNIKKVLFVPQVNVRSECVICKYNRFK